MDEIVENYIIPGALIMYAVMAIAVFSFAGYVVLSGELTNTKPCMCWCVCQNTCLEDSDTNSND